MLMKHMRSWIQMYQLQGIMSLLLLLLAASCSDSEKELEEPTPHRVPIRRKNWKNPLLLNL